MAADAPVHRAYVETRAASQAVQCFAQDRVGEHRAAAVVEDDDVHLARTIEFAVAARSTDEIGVGGEFLPGRGARENFEEMAQVGELRNDFLDSHHGDESVGNRAREAAVAFVFDQHQRAGFCDREIDAGDAELRVEEDVARGRYRAACRARTQSVFRVRECRESQIFR